MEGPSCKKLLNLAPDLIKDLPEPLEKYGHALHELNQVWLSCFAQALNEDYTEDSETKIQNFQKAYQKLELVISPKIHVIFQNVKEYCKMTKKSLGPVSEQTAESLHHDCSNMDELQGPFAASKLQEAAKKSCCDVQFFSYLMFLKTMTEVT